jgi:Spirocyclase AveC-like
VAATTTTDLYVPSTRPEIGDVKARTTKPVKVWAGIGVAWLALIVYQWADWLFSGHAKATPKGPSVAPDWMVVSARVWEIAVVVLSVITIRHFIVRPWRRERRLTLDGMLIIAWVFSWFAQDPWLSYSRQFFNYSSLFWNLGCPQCHAPGWLTPHGERMTEPIVWIVGVYISILFTFTVACNWMMRKAKQRWPRLGKAGLIGVAVLAFIAVDVVLELIFLRFGLYHYGGAIRWLTIFHGHYYQYPIYEGIFWGGTWALLACMRYFKNDKGETLAERGIDEVRATPRQKSVLRLLAICGLLNTIYFVGYNVPITWFQTHADSFPQDVLNRSYLTNMMCGPGTDTACPGPRVPMPVGEDSARLAPDGRTIAPAGVPVDVREGRR